jgi:archaemetzincin
MEKFREQQKEILLVPLGKVLVDILEEIAVALRKTYKFHVRIGRSEEPETSSYSDQRRQFDAERLLTLIQGRKRESLIAVLGVVDADMFAGEKAFVFGVHQPGRGAAVVALARLREEFYKKPNRRELFLRRAVTEAIFQVGMAAGFPPCIQKKCVFLPTTSLWRLDEKGQWLCAACQTRLEGKLHPVHSTTPAPAAPSGGEPQPVAPVPESATLAETAPTESKPEEPSSPSS